MATRDFSRTDRAISTVRKALAEPINALARARGVALATVTEVEVSSDLRYGTVHLSVYGDDAQQAAFLTAVRGQAAALQAVLGQTLRTRNVPVLSFTLDDSIARGDRISQMLRGSPSTTDE
jgi:ribosome-binding factor A